MLIRNDAILLNYSSEQVFEFIYQNKYRSKWDKVLLNYHTYEYLSDGQDKVYFFVEAGVPFVSKRDYTEIRGFKRDFPLKGDICVVTFSIDDPNNPPKKDIIRACTNISGYIIR